MTWTLSHRSLRLFTAAGLSLAAVGSLAACRTGEAPGTALAAVGQQGAQPGSPMLVNCAPGQQQLIRQVAINGAWVPQVECVTTPAAQATAPGMPGAMAPQVAQMPYAPPQYAQPAPAYAPSPVYAPAPAPIVYERPVATARPAARRVVYDDDVVEYRSPKKGRSWQKSAIIIGSSAGVGAGVGAATGGKKGSLIGEAI
jgi:pyruvate dehydrogenase E2 component (dihydrolipoamide acetyltransferase)